MRHASGHYESINGAGTTTGGGTFNLDFNGRRPRGHRWYRLSRDNETLTAQLGPRRAPPNCETTDTNQDTSASFECSLPPVLKGFENVK